MGKKLDEAAGRVEFRAIGQELMATRARMRALLARVKRTRGFHRSRRAFATDINADVSVPFAWAGSIEVALTSVSEAITELRRGRRERRRR